MDVFWGQRKTTWTDVREETLRVFFNEPHVVLIGRVANHHRCGLSEAEGILERLRGEGLIRQATKEEVAECGFAFGYARVAQSGQLTTSATG
jgi:hypothetical protein